MKQQKITTKSKLLTTKDKSTSGRIKKRLLKSKNTYRVSFRLPKHAVGQAKNVCLVGNFNSWDTSANPMKKLKSGDFTIMLDLEPRRNYQFRYLIDGSIWENDWHADRYVRNDYGDCDNSVVCLL